MGETFDTTRSGLDAKSSRPCSLANDSSSRRAAFPPTAWKPGRRSSGEATRGSSPRTKPRLSGRPNPVLAQGQVSQWGRGEKRERSSPRSPTAGLWRGGGGGGRPPPAAGGARPSPPPRGRRAGPSPPPGGGAARGPPPPGPAGVSGGGAAPPPRGGAGPLRPG